MALVKQGTLPIKVFRRATALLQLDSGQTLQQIAAHLEVTYNTVAAWRDSYRQEGLGLLYDKRCSGRPIQINGHPRAKITALACSPNPKAMPVGA